MYLIIGLVSGIVIGIVIGVAIIEFLNKKNGSELESSSNKLV